MNHKIISAKKRKFIALINKKEINNLEVNAFTNELVGEHRINFMIKIKYFLCLLCGIFSVFSVVKKSETNNLNN